VSGSSYNGALKTLFNMLQSAQSMEGVSIAFGEENKVAQEYPLPYVCMVPLGGPWQQPGYYRNADIDIHNQWMTTESVDFYLWAFDTDADATAIDHADATEVLRAQVLAALQQQAPNGLMFRPINGRWQLFQDQSARYGRAYVLTVSVDITVTDLLPKDTTVTEVTITAEISA
jgi:hypothetical protein